VAGIGKCVAKRGEGVILDVRRNDAYERNVHAPTVRRYADANMTNRLPSRRP
jgi:hypothetical protein